MRYAILASIAALAAPLALGTAAHAEPLPKGSVKLTAAEITPIYVGKSSKGWDDGAGYFAPDGWRGS